LANRPSFLANFERFGTFEGVETARSLPPDMILNQAERRFAVIRLHADCMSITSNAEYLQTCRSTSFATLKR